MPESLQRDAIHPINSHPETSLLSAVTGDPAQQLAEACAAALYQGDSLSRELGMTLDQIGPGMAELSMVVQPWMLNGHGTCHGGLIFTLADSAFAFACNSQNHKAVAAGCTIDYLNPAHGGDRLTARASQSHQRGRSGIYDVEVSNQQGVAIALFRGRAHRLPGAVIPGTEPPAR
ncbi:MAG TPA: hydroxyphenylacetyl-CoA thioesterase PaaI [Motiliproteus sp.]